MLRCSLFGVECKPQFWSAPHWVKIFISLPCLSFGKHFPCFFSHKLSCFTLRSAVLEMLCVHAELMGLSFAVPCFFRALGVQNSSESMEKSRGREEEIGTLIRNYTTSIHSALLQTPDGAALEPERFCHTNISWTHFGKPVFPKSCAPLRKAAVCLQLSTGKPSRLTASTFQRHLWCTLFFLSLFCHQGSIWDFFSEKNLLFFFFSITDQIGHVAWIT